MRNLLCFFLSGLLPVLAAASFDWDKTKELYPGVKLVKVELQKPRLMKVACMRIDLKTPGIRFYATGRAEGYGKPMPDAPKWKIHTERMRSTDFMTAARAKGINMLVAANATQWAPWMKPWNHRYADPSGLNIGNGQIVTDKRQSAVFAVWKDGHAEITRKIAKADYPKLQIAVSGFSILMLDGKPLPGGGYEKALHPRMAYGLSKDKRYLYLLTVDGRQPGWSLGASGPDTTQLLLDAGAADGINMDGGGSATLCYFNGKKPVVVNHHRNGVVRKVAVNIGIAFVPQKEKKP